MSRQHGTKEFWLAGLRAEGAAFRAAVGAAGALDAQVPSCPEWTVADLVRHLGGAYAWWCSHVSRGVTTPPAITRPPVEATPAGTSTAVVASRAVSPLAEQGAAELLEWWDARYAEALGVLDALDPDLPAWNWAPRAKKAQFWHRRAAHETAVHRWDAQVAAGLPEPIDSKLAADGIAEVLDTWLAAGRRRNPSSRPGVVALNASDVDQVWYVRLRGEGVALLDTDTLLDDDDHHERATAIGTASDLMLALYGRVPFDVLQISGDAGLLEGLRTG
jgi:uncharacterized protein (TIGR03083 family)